ncbi:histidine phosphatase family protein [Streptomyces canus]|uniref:histidine phosphatase family protein n=1 Tax=Streptomyces canus TaxID=58343 RepID=UPI00277F3C53|nr:histidine phosphatase family protein [Streptomyces canus]MDQ0757998.1 broad specificity phosphatase PhoE [Streptomyces canus]MDQ1073494.1 broad specificity phosphatase PhoE [Streptomyces canus]
MAVRLTLLCAAARTERAVRFADGPLDERALRRAEAAAGTLPEARTVYTAPSRRCTGTAEALGREAVTAQPALRDLDMGSWYGRTLDEIAATDASGLVSWLTDPEAAPHGGESVEQICDRVAAWLDALPSDAGRVLAVVEQAVARAAVVHALGAPHQAFWRIDVPPLSTVGLTGRDGRWNLRMSELPFSPRPPR